jgi:hypothetical protein
VTDDDFQRYVTLERASRVTGTPIGTLREWLRKGALKRHTNAGGFLVLVDLHELRPRPKVEASADGAVR